VTVRSTITKELKKGFAGKKDTPPGVNKSYAQLFAETEKLKASRNKLKKALKKNAKKNKKRKYADSSNSDSSNSNSE
jgi:seryl-tRNA synthetase